MSKKALLFTADEPAAKAEIERAGGRIVHQFSPTVLVAELPDGVDPAGFTAAAVEPAGPVDYATQLAIDAWIANSALGAAAPSPTEGLPWDTPGYEPPRQGVVAPPDDVALADDTIELSTGTPTSRYLIGSVAVGLVLVSRDHGAEAMTDAERTKILQEVQAGLDWLADAEPRAHLSWSYDIRPVTLSIAPGPYAGVSEPFERLERGWRDAALAALGYAAGRPGYQQYAKDLRAALGTSWAYIVFFTKYPLHHFAYAIWEKVVMHYDNDGWGPDNIHRVFAHESCHIFGAADEYGSCSCGGSHGHLGAPNNNCVNCFPPGSQVPCLMNANTLSVCEWTRRQLGWDPSLLPPQWHHNDLTNATGAPVAAGAPAGYMFDAQGTQHVVYRGTDSHIHELWWDINGWHHNDLTHAVGTAVSAGDPAGYLFDAQGTQHVVYRGTDSHIHELWWDVNGWHHNDLTNAVGAPMATGAPAGYVFDAQGTQHVIFRGTDSHIHELWWDANGWHYNDLTIAVGAPVSAGDPAGYMFDAQGTQHVVYRGTDSHVHELWWDVNGWHSNDLTHAVGTAASAGDPAGYVFDAQGTQHVVYRGTDSHIHELWWDVNGWHHNNLTLAVGAAVSAGDPAGYMLDAQGTQHVVYRGADSHIHELWWDANGWHHNDLTIAAGAPVSAGDPVGYMFDAQGTQHVIYCSDDGHINELWWG